MVIVFLPAKKTVDVQARNFLYCATLFHHLTTQYGIADLCWTMS